jgi:hypothetical protein
MDIAPDSTQTRVVLDILPTVRHRWELPTQRLWAQRIWSILRHGNPNLVHVVDTATQQARRSIEAELGIVQSGAADIHLTRDEWDQAINGIAHAASAVTAYALAEAHNEIAGLEANMTQPDPA